MRPIYGNVYWLGSEHGDCVLSNVIDIQDTPPFAVMVFTSLLTGKSVKIPKSAAKRLKLSDRKCCRFVENDDLYSAEPGETIFYFNNGSLHWGKFVSIDHHQIVLKRDKATVNVHKSLCLRFEHRFKKIEGTNAEYCVHCNALRTNPIKEVYDNVSL